MALTDISNRLAAGVPAGKCACCHALESMSDKDATTLRGLLADRGIRFRDLAEALKADAESPTVPVEALSRHARGICAARESLR